MENVGIKRRNLVWLWEIYRLSLENVVCKMRYLSWTINIRKNSKKMTDFAAQTHWYGVAIAITYWSFRGHRKRGNSQVIGISAGISISGLNSVSGTLFTSTFPCSWPRDRRPLWPVLVSDQTPLYYSGVWYDTSGRRIGFPGCWDETQLAGQIGATYVTVWIRVRIGYR